MRAWFTSLPAKQQAKHLDALYAAADADPTNFVKQDTLLRELVSAERRGPPPSIQRLR
jgi:ATP-dependent metalloprotease